MSQNQLIIQYLKEHKSITSYESFTELFVTRLASRIFDLKRLGYEFDEENITMKNRYGTSTTFKKYILKGES